MELDVRSHQVLHADDGLSDVLWAPLELVLQAVRHHSTSCLSKACWLAGSIRSSAAQGSDLGCGGVVLV